MSNKPIFSVVISTRNRVGLLEKLFLSLQEQSEHGFEVVVVDNGSDNQVQGVVKRWRKKTQELKWVYVKEKRVGISAARNRGARRASGSWLAFVDDDAKVSKHWAERVKENIEKKWQLFGGKILPMYLAEKPAWFKDSYETRQFGEKPRVLKPSEFLSGSNLVIAKELFCQLGGFEVELGMRGEGIGVGEETRLQMKARRKGKKIHYDPKLVVFHLVSKEKMKVSYRWKRALRAGKDHWKLIGKKRRFKWLALVPYSIGCIIVKVVVMGRRNHLTQPYWQNYAVEELVDCFFALGRGLSGVG